MKILANYMPYFRISLFKLQKRDLDANLKLRHKNEELVKIEAEIKELDGQVKVLNFDQLQRERSQKEKKMRDLEHRVSR